MVGHMRLTLKGLFNKSNFLATDYSFTGSSSYNRVAGSPNYTLRLLSSGTLILRKTIKIDLFLLGAGAGGHGGVPNSDKSGAGGPGGRTATVHAITLLAGVPYTVVVGAGGGHNAGGGWTYFDIYGVAGGDAAVTSVRYGSSGGSGSSTGTGDYAAGPASGSDGSDGVAAGDLAGYQGIGQHTTTREFGDPAGILYAGAGACGASGYTSGGAAGTPGAGGGAAGGAYKGQPGAAAAANTGAGGGGGAGHSSSTAGAGGQGGSGLCAIRNAR